MDHCYSHHLESGDVRVEVTPDLQRHLDALRVRDGEEIRVFNGRGLIATCRVSRAEGGAGLEVVSTDLVDSPTPLMLALGGLDHRDRFEFAVEKAVELGATAIIPLDTTYVQRHRTSTDRLVSKAVAALTQSGNPWLPQIAEPTSLESLLAEVPQDHGILLGDPDGRQVDLDLARSPLCCVVGPEGGFTNDEIAQLGADPRCIRIAIGRFRLRAETAGIAMLSAVRALRD